MGVTLLKVSQRKAQSMFDKATTFNQDIDSWNTAEVTETDVSRVRTRSAIIFRAWRKRLPRPAQCRVRSFERCAKRIPTPATPLP